MVLLNTTFMAPIQIKKLLLHRTNIHLRILILLSFLQSFFSFRSGPGIKIYLLTNYKQQKSLTILCGLFFSIRQIEILLS